MRRRDIAITAFRSHFAASQAACLSQAELFTYSFHDTKIAYADAASAAAPSLCDDIAPALPLASVMGLE